MQPTSQTSPSADVDYTQNWSKNVRFHADKVLFPTSVNEVIEIVKNPNYKSLKAFGSRHCFNAIADTDVNPRHEGGREGSHIHIGMEKMTRIVINTPIDNGPATVKFEAGVTFTQLMPALVREGYALANMPSLPHISVVGGILTGTHGSGIGNSIIAKSVVELDIVHADGQLVTYNRDSPRNLEQFWIHFGALGVVVSATMEVEANYQVAKSIYLDMPYQEFLEHIDEIMGAKQDAEFVSVFMDWKAPRMNSVWIGKKYYREEDRPDIPGNCFSAKHVVGNQFHPVPGQDPVACITTGYGSWTNKVNHFLPDHPPSSAGNEIQAEYFVPYPKFRDALEALWKIRGVFANLVQITELRAIAQDFLPLSQAKNGPAVGIHFTLFKASPDVLNKALKQVEDILSSFNHRLHWGKWFVCRSDQLERMYGDDLIKLRRLIQQHDPSGKFCNDYIRSCVLGTSASV